MRNRLRQGIIGAAIGAGLGRLALAHARRRVARGKRVLQVVNLHGTPRRHLDAFRRQLTWVLARFSPIAGDHLADLWSGRANPALDTGKPLVAFTFDDGLANNYRRAAALLEELGARGFFFVCPGFCELEGDAARRFFYERVALAPEPPAADPEDWTPMTPDQIRDLVARGHTVGNHTFSHCRLSELPEDRLHHEIVTSRERLAEWTGGPVDTFCWTFSWQAIRRQALDLVRRHHDYVFVPCPGRVHPPDDGPELIWRTNVECFYPRREYEFMYSGLVAPFWRSQRQSLRDRLIDETPL